MYNCKSSFDGLFELPIVRCEVSDTVIWGNYKVLVIQRYGTTFCFASAKPPVPPDLQVMIQASIVQIFENYSLLSCVAVPPFILSFYVMIWIFCSSIMTFSGACDAEYPNSSTSWMVNLWSGVQFIQVDRLNKSLVIFKWYQTFFDTFGCANFKNLFVARCAITRDVPSRRLQSEFPWSI